jgi:indole-3-glycerol phosphate synthase
VHAGVTILDEIIASTRAELAERRRRVPVEDLAAVSVPARAGLREALARPGLALIAEFKRRSPSAGEIRAGSSPSEIARAYERGGAAAMSVLTDGPYFGGSLADLREAAGACALPLLRKDFILEEYQLHEARAAGASAVLLIVAALDQERLGSLLGAAHELGLDALVEVHDAPELARAAAAGAQLIGVNNRDLRDFSVDAQRTFALLAQMPQGALVVAESGISDARMLARLEAAGVAGALVGERLMRAASPERALRELLTGD